MFQKMKERHFAKRWGKQLLKAHSTVSAARPDLTGKALYKEILLHTQQVDEFRAAAILLEAEDSIDDWTAPGRKKLRFRELVHYFVFVQYLEAGHEGSIVSMKDIIDSLVPADI